MTKRRKDGQFAKGGKRRRKVKKQSKLSTRVKRLGRKIGRAGGRIRSVVGGRL